MHSRELTVEEAQRGLRLDRFLCEALPGLGRAAARRLLDGGEVLLNGRRAAAAARVAAADVVTVPVMAGANVAPVADATLPLQVVHEDRSLLIIDKPAFMPCHPLRAGEGGTLVSALLARYPELAGVGYATREPGLLHRLDTGTSGLLLVARDQATFDALRDALRAGALDKRYQALCVGALTAPAVHHGYLRARGARVTVRSEPFADAVPITTELLSAQALSAFTLVEVRARFARRHQIRAHLAALGHPLASDEDYGGAALPGLRRHFLHASALRFTHPVTGQALSVASELPEDLRAALTHAYG